MTNQISGFRRWKKSILAVFVSIALLVSSQYSLIYAEQEDSDKQSQVTLKGTSSKVGNIFTEGEVPAIDVQFGYDGQQKTKLQGTYKVLSYDKRKLAEGKISESIEAGKVTEKLNLKFDAIKANGTYTIVVDAATDDGKNDFHGEVPFSIVPKTGDTSALSFLGTNTHFGQGIGDPEKMLTLIKNAGFKFIRDGYRAPNKYVDIAIEKGIEVLMILHIPSEGTSGFKVGSDEHIAYYAKSCGEKAAELKGKVKYFEIGNEFNGGDTNPDRLDGSYYFKLMKAAYEAIKKANPDAIVVGGGLFGSDYGYAQQILEAGGADFMDSFSYHPYTNSDPVSGGYTETNKQMKDIMEGKGFDGSLWVTEYGWHNSDSAAGVSELQSASYLMQSNVLTMASSNVLEKVFYYEFLDDGVNISDGEQSFGVVKGGTLPSAKLGYVAYTAFSKLMGNVQFVKEYNQYKDIKLYKFERKSDKKDIVVAWSVGDSKAVGIDLGTNKLSVIDMLGNESKASGISNSYSVVLTAAPTYFVGDFSEDISLVNPMFKFETDEQNVVPGDTIEISIDRAYGGKSITGSYQADLPDGWELVGDSSFKKSERDVLKIKASEQLTDESSVINVYPVNKSGERIGSLQMNLRKVDALEVLVKPVPINKSSWNDWEMEVTMTNNYSSQSIESGTLKILGPKRWIDDKDYPYEGLKPGETKIVKIPFKTTDLTPEEVVSVVPVSQGKVVTADSEETGKGNLALKAVDGDAKNTRWCANDSKLDHWLKVDLGNEYDLMGTEVKWETKGNLYKYKIEVSSDDVNWQVVADKTQNKDNSQILQDRFSAKGRYVRITATGLDQGRWASIFEFKVYDVANPMPEGEPKEESLNLRLEVKPGNGDAFIVDKGVTFLASTYTENMIVIDGDIKNAEWDGAMQVNVNQPRNVKSLGAEWGGISDLSMAFKTKWDAENLYLAVSVIDDKYFQTLPGSSIWQGDGIQLSVDPNRIYEPGSLGWTEMGFALRSDTEALEKYRWNTIAGRLVGDFESAECVVKRVTEQVTVYEVAIPWKELLPDEMQAEPGLDIGFSMLANDNDGTGRKGFIEYMSGIGTGKNPTKYGDMVLVDRTGKFVKTEQKAETVDYGKPDGPITPTTIIIGVVVLLLLGGAGYIFVFRKRK